MRQVLGGLAAMIVFLFIAAVIEGDRSWKPFIVSSLAFVAFGVAAAMWWA